jgi:hypothetical protein
MIWRCKSDLDELLAGKERRRHELARLPIEVKIRDVIRRQQWAAAILRQRGKVVHCWQLPMSHHG